MDKKRRMKKRAKEHAEKTGMSYQAALQQLGRSTHEESSDSETQEGSWRDRITMDHDWPKLEEESSPWAWFKLATSLGFGWDMVVGVTARLDDALRLQEPFASKMFGLERPTVLEVVRHMVARCLDRELEEDQVRALLRFYVHAPTGKAWETEAPTGIGYDEWLEWLEAELRRQWDVTDRTVKQPPSA